MRKHREGWGCVYLITNLVNGKRYTGYDTTGDPENHRWKHHKARAVNTKDRRPLYAAMRKAYKRDGHWKNFKLEIIWRGPIEDLSAKEVYYVKKLHTYNRDPFGDKSYNMTLGGEGFHGKVSKRTRRLMIATQILRYTNPAEHEKLSTAQLRRYEDELEHEKQSAGGRRRYENLAEREKTGAAAVRAWAAKTPEERVSISTKIWATRRANILLQSVPKFSRRIGPECRKGRGQ